MVDPTEGADDIFDKQTKEAERIIKLNEASARKLLEHQKKVAISSQIISDRQEKHLLMENRLMTQRKLMSTMQRIGAGGGVMGNVMNMMQSLGGIKVSNYQRLQELNKKGLDMDSGDIKERNMLKGGAGNKTFERLDKTFEKYFGGDSKWNKMFGGHGKMAAMGVGMGAVGGGLALTKAIIDSSMMLQQMLKLLQFGVMLILKPIGDFFGFLMRPIMILLLRKFIIPFYQKVYPWFATTGNKIGTDIAKVLDQLSEVGVIPIALGGLAAAIGTAIAGKKVFQGLFKGFTETQMTKFANIIGKSIENKGTTPIPQRPPVVGGGAGKFTGGTTTSGGTFMGRDDPMKNKTLSKYSSNPAIKKVQKFMDRINDIKLRRPDIPQSQIQSQITEFMDKQKSGGANGVIDKLKRVLTSNKFLNKIGGTLAKGGFWGLAHELMLDMFNIDIVDGNYDPATDPKNMMAKGGIIREPIKGIGQRTGQSYLLGESGSEAVIPMNKMGGMGGTTTVNISIGNMSGNANDLNKLRSTILEVMQTVNVNRGR